MTTCKVIEKIGKIDFSKNLLFEHIRVVKVLTYRKNLEFFFAQLQEGVGSPGSPAGDPIEVP